MKRIGFFILLFGILLALGIFLSRNWQVRDAFLEWQYDRNHQAKEVYSSKIVGLLCDSFGTDSFAHLDEDYLLHSGSTKDKYRPTCTGLRYSKVKRDDLNMYLVGHFRVKDFICKDEAYKDCMLHDREYVICVLNRKVILKTLELMNELKKAGHDPHALHITNGHRHPAYNEQIKGASMSRHIRGEAIDITVTDIDQNGKVNQRDKSIVLDILEKKVIGNEGGIGLYPGTLSLHYDVRGIRARWDSY